MAKILICVDCQYDFIEGGNLPVEGGTKALDYLANYVADHSDEYDAIVMTLDWHPSDHCSFTENGGVWPKHCVRYSHGASIYNPLVKLLPVEKTVYFEKGCKVGKDEYSFLGNRKNVNRFKGIIESLRPDAIDVCGIAGDVCVMNTIKDLLSLKSPSSINVIMPAVASLNDATFAQFITEQHLNIVK